MKRQSIITILAIALALGAGACSKKKDKNTSEAADAGKQTAAQVKGAEAPAMSDFSASLTSIQLTTSNSSISATAGKLSAEVAQALKDNQVERQNVQDSEILGIITPVVNFGIEKQNDVNLVSKKKLVLASGAELSVAKELADSIAVPKQAIDAKSNTVAIYLNVNARLNDGKTSLLFGTKQENYVKISQALDVSKAEQDLTVEAKNISNSGWDVKATIHVVNAKVKAPAAGNPAQTAGNTTKPDANAAPQASDKPVAGDKAEQAAPPAGDKGDKEEGTVPAGDVGENVPAQADASAETKDEDKSDCDTSAEIAQSLSEKADEAVALLGSIKSQEQALVAALNAEHAAELKKANDEHAAKLAAEITAKNEVITKLEASEAKVKTITADLEKSQSDFAAVSCLSQEYLDSLALANQTITELKAELKKAQDDLSVANGPNSTNALKVKELEAKIADLEAKIAAAKLELEGKK